jgi:fructose transport system permease protein
MTTDIDPAAAAGTATIAEFEQSRGTLDAVQRWLHGHPLASPALVLIVAALYFALSTDRFFTATNLSTILAQVTIIGTVAVAQTMVVLTAGIDLSVGSMTLLSSIVMGKLALDWGYPAVLALLIGIGIGLLCGLLNGVLITRLRIPPFIATLGTFNALFALAQWFSENETLRNADIQADASIFLWFDNTWEPINDFRVTYGSMFMLLLFVVSWYALRRTAWGRHVYATGDDREAARLVGIRTDRVLLSVYGLAGLVCGLAGWLWISRIGSVSPKPLENANLDSITAVVIGGTSLFGGRGSVFGSLLGALIVGVFDSGLSQAGVDPLWRTFAIGVLVIVAVGLDQWLRKVAA